MKTPILYSVIFTLLFCTIFSCKKSPVVNPGYTPLYQDPHDSTLLSGFIGYYIYSFPQYQETYLYDNKKRLALVHATRVDGYEQASVINDSMFLYYNGDDTLVNKIVTRTKSGVTKKETTFVLGYNANRQVIYDTLYEYHLDGSPPYMEINYNTYNYTSPGVINSVSGNIGKGLPVAINKTYYPTYDNNKNLVEQKTIDNTGIIYTTKLVYSNTLSPYYKIFKLNYGFMPGLLPLGFSGPGIGTPCRYSDRLPISITSTSTAVPPSTSSNNPTYTQRSDNYALSFQYNPNYYLGYGLFIINYGNFIYNQ